MCRRDRAAARFGSRLRALDRRCCDPSHSPRARAEPERTEAVITTARSEKHALLHALPLFRELDEPALATLAQAARVEHLLVRGELFHEGEAGTQLYVVVQGRLKVVTTSSGGDDVVFSIPGPGDVIGELGFLGGGPRTASVIALEDCELLALDRRDLLPLLRSRPAVALRLLDALAQRLRGIDRFTKDTLFANVSVRLAKRLLELAARYGEPTEAGVRISLRLSQEELGDFAAATREAVNRQLRAWAEAGIVAMARGDITIRQPAQLEAIASLAAA